MGIALNENVQKILKYFEQNKKDISKLTILTHNYPDPDALASAFALYHLAKEVYGVNARIIYRGVIGRMENRAMMDILNIPAKRFDSISLEANEHVALVDTQPAFKNNPCPKGRRVALVIDQHEPVEIPNADLAIIQTDVGATSIITAECLLQSGVEIPPNIATALVYGILSDTMNFYRCSDPEVIKTYLNVLPKGDMILLAKIQNPRRGKDYFKSLGKILLGCEIYGDAVVAHLKEVDTPDLVAQAADFLLNYDQVVWSLVTARFGAKLYVSLRSSQSEIPAYEVLRDIVPNKEQAGGHDVIAGGSFEVDEKSGAFLWEEAEEKLLEKFVKRLNISIDNVTRNPFGLSVED